MKRGNWKRKKFLKKSKQIEEIYCFPGNAGTNDISKNGYRFK